MYFGLAGLLMAKILIKVIGMVYIEGCHSYFHHI